MTGSPGDDERAAGGTAGVDAPGVAFGGPCYGDVYVTASVGWAVCNNGSWAYTEVDPADEGFLADNAIGGNGSQGGDETFTLPPIAVSPAGPTFPDGIVIGATCSGEV